MMFRRTARRLLVIAGCAMPACLLMLVVGWDIPFASREATAVAVLSLLLSVLLIDFALFGESVSCEAAGAAVGLSGGFLVRQSMVHEHLAAGADRVATTAFVFSLILIGWRFYRLRQRA